jgi:hypothetical protein
MTPAAMIGLEAETIADDVLIVALVWRPNPQSTANKHRAEFL